MHTNDSFIDIKVNYFVTLTFDNIEIDYLTSGRFVTHKHVFSYAISLAPSPPQVECTSPLPPHNGIMTCVKAENEL